MTDPQVSSTTDSEVSEEMTDEQDPMLAVYCHDVHKLRGRSHVNAAESFAGIRVNEQVPLGADGDAALLSRPRGQPEQTLDNHVSPYRVSLLTGEVAFRGLSDEDVAGLRELVRIDDPVEMHAAWLSSSVVSKINKSPYYPYTSLKFHTLLAAALFDNYRAGFGFDELYLVARSSPDCTPHRTVLSTSGFALVVTGEPDGQPAARLGPRPARSFADVWARLPEHPFDVDGEGRWRVLDAQLRRIRSWSAALQYIEEFVAAYGPELNPLAGRGAAGIGGDGRAD